MLPAPEPASACPTARIRFKICLERVVSQDVGQVLDPVPRLVLQPRRRQSMASGSVHPRDLLVDDVSHRERARSRTRRRPASSCCDWHGRAPCERVRGARVRLAHWSAVAHLGKRARPKHLADHSGVLEQALPVRGERVEAGGDQRLERLGHRSGFFTDAAVGDQAHELLGVQGVPARPLQQCLLRLGRETAARADSRSNGLSPRP